MSPRLLDNAVNRCKAKTRSFALFFGCKKRLKDFRLYLIRHSRPRIGDINDNETLGFYVFKYQSNALVFNVLSGNFRTCNGYFTAALTFHRVACIYAEIHKYSINLTLISSNRG